MANSELVTQQSAMCSERKAKFEQSHFTINLTQGNIQLLLWKFPAVKENEVIIPPPKKRGEECNNTVKSNLQYD